MSTEALTVVVPDLSDPAVRANARALLDQLLTSPPSGLDLLAKDQVIAMLTKSVGWKATLELNGSTKLTQWVNRSLPKQPIVLPPAQWVLLLAQAVRQAIVE